MKLPEVIKKRKDSNTFQSDIESQIEGKIPFYTPEWTLKDDKDVGVALYKIFAYMAETAIKRLNNVPQKHFLSFLETINTSLIPAQPARVPLTFQLSKGAPEVLIPELTQAAAPGPDGKPIIFETEKDFRATPSNLVSVVSVIKEKDEIFDHKISINGTESTDLFRGENKQEHILYLGDKNLFNIKKANIIIEVKDIEVKELKKLSDPDYCTWNYSVEEVKEKKNGEEVKNIRWLPLGVVKFEKKNNPQIILKKDGNLDIPNDEVNLNGFKSRWIRCQVNDSKITEVEDIKISNLKISVSPSFKGTSNVPEDINPDIAFSNDVPIDPSKEFYPFGDKPQIYSTLYIASKDAFSKKDYQVALIINLIPGTSSSGANIPRLSWEYWDGEAWSPLEGIIENFSSSSVYHGKVESAESKNITLENNGSESKKDYTEMLISITGGHGNFQTRKIISYDKDTRKAIVDYEWSINPDSSSTYRIYPCYKLISTDQPKSKLNVTLPSLPEIKLTKINGKENYWIRVRLIGGDFGKEYEVEGDKVYPGYFCPPIIKSLKINYSTGEEGFKEPDYILTRNNLKLRQVKESLVLSNRDNISEDDNERLKEFLEKNFDISWVKTAQIEKIENGKTIKVSSVEKSLTLRIDEEKSSISLKIDHGTTDEFIFQKSGNKLNIYRTFNPFETLIDNHPAVYFGFDRALRGGPFSLFISIYEKLESPEDFRPRVRWTSKIKDSVWKQIDSISDETRGFIGSGIVQFFISGDMMSETMFGSKDDIYWIRAEIIENFFATEVIPSTPSDIKFLELYRKKESKYSETDNATNTISKLSEDKFKKCSETIDILNVSLVSEGLKKLPPKIMGFYFNSAWAVQLKTITDEIIGSSTGERHQEFQLLNSPVLIERKDEKISVNEFNSLTESERRSIKDAQEKKDDQGNPVEFWVVWKRVSDFINSKANDRHYIIDRATGEIQFGDGNRGMVPPIGLNNIKATYSTGGGVSGNIGAGQITKLQSAVPFVDKVNNPVASDGGMDTEDIDSLIDRGPAVLKHRNRAVALDDYIWLTKQASKKIARVKVLPNFDHNAESEDKFKTGYVTIIIIPQSSEVKPVPWPELRRNVKKYLEDRCSNVITLSVIQPSYVSASISAVMITNDLNAIPEIENKAKVKIAEFLHPLTGGTEGKGWDFGSIPCISDIYSILEGIEKADYVTKVMINIQADEDSKVIKITDTSGIIKLPEYALLYSGEHDITAKWRDENLAT